MWWAALGLGTAFAEKRVAVVVGVSEYANKTLSLDGARADGKRLGEFLEDSAGYEEVHLLLDGVATKGSIESLLTAVPQSLKEGDTLLFAFFGHGVGADFGDPYLLTYDTNMEAVESTAVRVRTLVQDLAPRLQGRNLVLMTDAAHEGSAGGVSLLGPTAKDWPSVPIRSFLLSATSRGEVAPSGLFADAVIEALSGAADSNDDGQVSASELHRSLLLNVAETSKDTVHPTEAGSYDPNLIIGTVGNKVVASVPAPVKPEPAPLPKAPKEKKPRSERGWGGVVSYSLIGLGAVGLGGGVYNYGKGMELCDEVNGELDCPDSQAFNIYRERSYAGYLLGSVAVASGIGLGFVPIDGGGVIGIHLPL